LALKAGLCFFRICFMSCSFFAILGAGPSLSYLFKFPSPPQSIDFPLATGTPANPDIPCNMLSLLKIRDGKLEWLQIIRSNDLFLGVPYNFVQFTCLQEIMAGWLGIDCGSYHQISDSLHIYERDEINVLKSSSLNDYPKNMDLLASPKEKSEWAFKEIEQRIYRMIAPELRFGELQIISGGPVPRHLK